MSSICLSQMLVFPKGLFLAHFPMAGVGGGEGRWKRTEGSFQDLWRNFLKLDLSIPGLQESVLYPP